MIELNPGGYTTLARFFEASVPLTLVTIWVIVAFQNRLVLRDDRAGVWRKFLWPIVLINSMIPWPTRNRGGLGDDIPLRPR